MLQSHDQRSVYSQVAAVLFRIQVAVEIEGSRTGPNLDAINDCCPERRLHSAIRNGNSASLWNPTGTLSVAVEHVFRPTLIRRILDVDFTVAKVRFLPLHIHLSLKFGE
jgi:hypothetical protein